MKWIFGIFAIGLTLFFLGFGDASGPKDDNQFVFKSMVKAAYGGRAVEGSSVLSQPRANGPLTWTRGEATIIDLGSNKRAYMLLVDRGGKARLYLTALGTTFKPPRLNGETRTGIYAMPYDEPKLYDPHKTHLAKSLKEKYFAFPLLVAFEDENDPTSIFLIDTEKPTTVFGKQFVFKGVYLERKPLETSLTREIQQYLPWVDPNHQYWKIKPGNQLKELKRGVGASDQELAAMVGRTDFVSSDRRF